MIYDIHVGEFQMGFQDEAFLHSLMLVFTPHFLKAVVEIKASGPPHFLKARA